MGSQSFIPSVSKTVALIIFRSSHHKYKVKYLIESLKVAKFDTLSLNPKMKFIYVCVCIYIIYYSEYIHIYYSHEFRKVQPLRILNIIVNFSS